MGLALPCQELFAPYSEALRAWLVERHEAGLEPARELGRLALSQGIRASEMGALHHESLTQIMARLQDSDDLTSPEAVVAAGVFFAESMSAFDAKESELRRSNVALRYQNDKLESEIHRFTQTVYNEGLQLLAAARLAVAEAAGELKPSARVPFDEVESLLEQVENQLVSCSDNLRPRVLEDLGPRAAVQSLCRRFSRAAHVEVKAELGIFAVPDEIGLALYKAVLEALNNVERHARANRVRIWLYEENSVIHCFVQDDGVGFDVPPVLSGMEHRGSGLGSVAESLRAVGGSMAIDSVLGSGTEMRISIEQTAEQRNDQKVSRSAS